VRRRQRAWAGWIARAWLPGVVAATVFSSASARGDEPDATGTFDYGLSEMLARRYATGCPALESSFRTDPRPGTLFTLADCERKWGKTASALERFEEYLALYERMPPDQRAKPRERERASIAESERAILERTVPLLAVRLPGDAPAGTRVWRDDVELAGAALATAVPVDPGEHRLRAELPDGRVVEQQVSIEGREQRTVTFSLAPVPPAPAPVAAVAAPVRVPAGVEPSLARTSAPGSHAGWTYAAAGIGAASLAVAGVTGGVALAQRSTASPVCNAAGLCTTQAGANAGNGAHTMANVETGALVVGGVALAATLILWLTEPHARGTNAAWAPGSVTAVW
jgi:hypothetical protein